MRRGGEPRRVAHRPVPRPGRALGLRARIVVVIAGLSFVLSVGLSSATYVAVRMTLLDERRASVIDQAAVNGRVLREALRSELNVPQLLSSLQPPERSRPMLFRGGEWFTTSLPVGPEDLPAALREEVAAGRPAVQRFWAREQPMIAVGLPLEERPDSYFEVVSLAGLHQTLSTLARVLLVFGTVTTAGGALIGWRVSGRLLRPLRNLTEVTEAIASGDLDRRVERSADRDLARLSASFNRMAASLQDRILREGRFASDVSHELRSPLTTLMNAVEVLERRHGELSPAGQEALELLGADIRRFVRMTSELLEISRYDTGTVEPSLEEVDLVPFVRLVLAGLGCDQSEVVVDGPAHDPVVRADRRRLERVLANLVENAELHGRGLHRVVVLTAPDGVRVAVDDRGPGVPEDERERIFERFARGSQTSRREGTRGTGLGLALVAEHLRVQQGRTWVEDAPDGGARFVVHLPAAPRSATT